MLKTMLRRSVLLLAFTFLASCGTQSQLETSWEVPDQPTPPFTELAVIAVLQNQDNSGAFESKVAEVFEKNGVKSVPGFTFLKGRTDLSRKDMAVSVTSSGADGVLIFKLVAVDSTETYVPPTTYTVPATEHREWWEDRYWGYYTPYPYDYWGYWYPAVQVVENPGYWEQHQTYRMHVALYSAAKDRLVWTANAATFDPTSPANEGGSVGELILDQLQHRHLVAKG